MHFLCNLSLSLSPFTFLISSPSFSLPSLSHSLPSLIHSSLSHTLPFLTLSLTLFFALSLSPAGWGGSGGSRPRGHCGARAAHLPYVPCLLFFPFSDFIFLPFSLFSSFLLTGSPSPFSIFPFHYSPSLPSPSASSQLGKCSSSFSF